MVHLPSARSVFLPLKEQVRPQSVRYSVERLETERPSRKLRAMVWKFVTDAISNTNSPVLKIPSASWWEAEEGAPQQPVSAALSYIHPRRSPCMPFFRRSRLLLEGDFSGGDLFPLTLKDSSTPSNTLWGESVRFILLS